MGIHITSLHYDKTRCMGSNCTVRKACLRYVQIEHDPVMPTDHALRNVSSMIDTDGMCQMKIEID